MLYPGSYDGWLQVRSSEKENIAKDSFFECVEGLDLEGWEKDSVDKDN